MLPIPSCRRLLLPDGRLAPIRTLGSADGGRPATVSCGATQRLFNLTRGHSRRKRREARKRKKRRRKGKKMWRRKRRRKWKIKRMKAEEREKRKKEEG